MWQAAAGPALKMALARRLNLKILLAWRLIQTENLYTLNDDDPRIRKISPVRKVSVYAGTETPGFSNGDANNARFGFGDYLVTDAAGNVYVSDADDNCIRTISVTGQVTTIAVCRSGFLM